jgi:hypothetical protein
VASAAVVVVLALAGMIGVGRRADAASRDAARVVEQMRSAADDVDFTATAMVTWHATSGAPRQATVSLRSADGTLEVTSADEVVLDEHGHTFVKDDVGWWTPAKEPAASRQPAPDARWHLEARHGTTLGRPTTTVVASRADGSVAQRLVIDDATHVLIGREVLDRDGTGERGFRFTALTVGPAAGAGTQVITASPRAPARDATAVRDVGDGFDAPSVIGNGYQLVSRARHGDGVRLVYSDGLFTLTVVEQSGELDWSALPDGGASTSVDGARARRYAQPVGDAVIWQSDGVVFTCVSDAPRDSYAAAIGGISSGPGVVERAVDFVLAPFAFD